MKLIKATRKGKEYDVIVDDDFYYSGMTNVLENGYVRIHVDKKTITLHRYVMNAKKGEIVDHINGNKLDNRRENLRVVTNGQNRSNTKKNKGYVFIQGKYMSRITVKGEKIYLGRFNTPEEAQEAYRQASVKHFGEHSPWEVKQ